MKCVHFHRLQFASLTRPLASHQPRGHKTGVPVQPAAQHFNVAERSRLAGQVCEHGLRHVARQVRISSDPAQRRGMDEVDEPVDQFPKSGFVPTLGIVAQQLQAVGHAHFIS